MTASAPADPKRSRRFARGRPWRDNLEALTMAVIVAVLLKYFVVEAYKIPTGSMQPTLMGWDGEDGEGIHDRVLVDKLSFHFRDPERFEVVVFKYPLDRAKNFIKRVVGLPNERLKIEYGDLWRAEPGSDDWSIVRKPAAAERSLLREIDGQDGWAFLNPRDWSYDGTDIVANGAGTAVFPGDGGDVLNEYLDGYEPNLRTRMGTPARATGGQFVGDLRVETEVAASDSCTLVVLELREGRARYRAEIPGPGAAPDAHPRLMQRVLAPARDIAVVRGADAMRLPPGRGVRVALQNIDDRVRLEVDGEVLLTLEVPPARERQAGVRLTTMGGGARFAAPRVWRDVHYTSQGVARHEWNIPADSYVMLGDNTQDSSDSREWELTNIHLIIDGEPGPTVRGDHRPDENPYIARRADDQRDFFFVDEWGERRHFVADEAHRSSEPAGFVRREQIIGRGVVVFWPLNVSWGIYRLQWIR